MSACKQISGLHMQVDIAIIFQFWAKSIMCRQLGQWRNFEDN